MSDIGFYGLATAVVGMVMLAIAAVGFLIEALLLRKRRRAARASHRVPFGPLLYGVAALAMLYMAEAGSLAWQRTLDDAAVPIAVAALIPWIGVHLYQRRRTQETD